MTLLGHAARRSDAALHRRRRRPRADGLDVDPTPQPTEFPQESLTRLDKPMRPQRAVERLRTHVRDNVMAQSESRGVLSVEKTKMLGIFPTTSYVIRDGKAISDIRDAVGNVARGDRRRELAGAAVKKAMWAVQAAVMAMMVASTVAETSVSST